MVQIQSLRLACIPEPYGLSEMQLGYWLAVAMSQLCQVTEQMFSLDPANPELCGQEEEDALRTLNFSAAVIAPKLRAIIARYATLVVDRQRPALNWTDFRSRSCMCDGKERIVSNKQHASAQMDRIAVLCSYLLEDTEVQRLGENRDSLDRALSEHAVMCYIQWQKISERLEHLLQERNQES